MDLKQKLKEKEIYYKYAYEQIKQLPKPWNRPEWEHKRSKLIKSECEACGSSNKLTLQHTKHPIKFREFRNRFIDKLLYIYCKSINLDKLINDSFDLDVLPENRLCCPVCERLTIRYRETYAYNYICALGHKFKQPKIIDYYKHTRTKDREVAKESYTKWIKSQAKRILTDLYDDRIGRACLLFAMDESEIYMSMKYTKTLCGSCAFKEDRKYIK